MSDIAVNPTVAGQLEIFRAWLESAMAYQGWPGVSVGIVHDQRLIWSRGFGLADVKKQTPMTPATIHRIASITKVFTAVGLLQQRDAGKLQLDDPVTKYLPWFKPQNSFPNAPVTTLRHLLTHTAGLPRESDAPYWTNYEFPSREEVRLKLQKQPTALPTESAWKYSNLGLTIAGEVLAAVSGQTYEDYIEARILKPLGMSSTFVRTIDPSHAQLAAGYSRRLPGNSPREVVRFSDCAGISPAANMASNVEDLAKFASFLLRSTGDERDSVLRLTTAAEMQRIHWLHSDWISGWGLGFRIVRANGRTLVGHGGALRGYRTQLQLSPAEKIGVIVMINADDGNGAQIFDKIFQWVAPAIVKAAEPPPIVRTAAQNLQRYTGRYRSAWNDFEVIVVNGELVGFDPTTVDPNVGTTRFTSTGEHTFRIDSKDGFGSLGESAEFVINPAGIASELRMGQGVMQRVESW
jgi:CubicO group peptidase (beta-lactamase class C family)